MFDEWTNIVLAGRCLNLLIVVSLVTEQKFNSVCVAVDE